jgi:hypothetical protein
MSLDVVALPWQIAEFSLVVVTMLWLVFLTIPKCSFLENYP